MIDLIEVFRSIRSAAAAVLLAGAALVQGSAPAHADLISALGAGPYDALPLPGLTGYGYHLFNATKDSVTGDISNLPAWASVTTTGTAAAGATLLDITYGPPGFLGTVATGSVFSLFPAATLASIVVGGTAPTLFRLEVLADNAAADPALSITVQSDGGLATLTGLGTSVANNWYVFAVAVDPGDVVDVIVSGSSSARLGGLSFSRCETDCPPPPPVPEPASLSLLAAGTLCLALRRRRRTTV